MSMAEIADNKFELQASKPPVATFSGIAQIFLIACFAGVFVYIFQGVASGIFSAKKEGGMADNYGKMTNEATPAKK